jgi:5-methylcytosine-specific restriction enzyme subunit McrC
LVFNRKSEIYRKTIEIAKLLLLQYHPDVSKGRNNVLALMFDMNKLWEQFIFISLRRHAPELNVSAQTSKDFWKPENANRTMKIRPDIVVNKDSKNCVVLDTKWKNLNGYNPSPDDLRQMYVYHEYFGAQKTALVYPGEGAETKGTYSIKDEKSIDQKRKCYIIPVNVESNIKIWQKNIAKKFSQWID